nr:DUF4337 domain-containing protein [Polymorphobacter sp.]
MEADDLPAEGANKRLNRMVAVTVVLLSVCLGLCNIKDGNIVQAMTQSKADAVDTWGEYQATRTKLHIDETAAAQLGLLAKGPEVSAQQAVLAAEIAKYKAETPALQTKAKAFEANYDALNVHDDQFDAADALMSIGVSAAAVSAVVETFAVLAVAWAFGGFGIIMGLAGFLGWAIHPAFVASFLG